MAQWNGTLAALRDLGRRGIDVHVASSSVLGPALWSRQTGRRLRSPAEKDAGAQVAWLLDQGRRLPGRVLLATSDSDCFLMALHAEELSRTFQLSTPSLEVLRNVLDKDRLLTIAAAAGLRTPTTLQPRTLEDAGRMATEMPWPGLLKHRTQVLGSGHKGEPVRDAGDLARAWHRFEARSLKATEVLSAWPGVDAPMLQEYLPAASASIYCLSGFLTRNGQSWVTRASRKVLSRPRFLGIGVSFEHAEIDPELEAGVLRLCRSAGYHGVFQCEFLENGDTRLLIDFNPRFYNFMAFDQARGLPMAYLAYLDAVGDDLELRRQIGQARVVPPGSERMVYHHHVEAGLQLLLERAMGRIAGDEVSRLRAWRRNADVIDPVWERGDLLPGLADLAMRAALLLRHPRAFFRQYAARPFEP